ncbi:ABC transporter substrate-binding protein [Desulfosoma sp.]|uniref:ABC transporter substrate-binding protein n=1 Tax=Desulfosoma sp. TaxID=2603217 RepID=UPI00404A9D18
MAEKQRQLGVSGLLDARSLWKRKGRRGIRSMKHMGFLLCFLVSWVPLKGCFFKDPVRVGFVGPLTGRFSDLGTHGRNGAMLVAEFVNASGGVKGRPLELVLADDEGTVSGAVASVHQLLSQGDRIFLGPMTSTQVLAVLPSVDQFDAVCLSPTASSQVLDNRADALFRMAPSDAVQVEALAERILLDRHARTVVVLWDADNEAFAKAYAEGFGEAFRRRGGIVVAQYPFRSSMPSAWESLMQPIQHTGSEAVLVIASAKETAYLCQWLARKGIKAAVFTSFWARSAELMVYGGAHSRRRGTGERCASGSRDVFCGDEKVYKRLSASVRQRPKPRRCLQLRSRTASHTRPGEIPGRAHSFAHRSDSRPRDGRTDRAAAPDSFR